MPSTRFSTPTANLDLAPPPSSSYLRRSTDTLNDSRRAPHVYIDHGFGKSTIVWPGKEFPTVRLCFDSDRKPSMYYKQVKPLQYALSQVATRRFNGKQELETFRVLWRAIEAKDAPVKVTLEHRSAWFENRPGNAVMELLKEDYDKKYPPSPHFTSPDYKSDWTITPNVPPFDGKPIPTVYVAGRLEQSVYNNMAKIACASLWVPESIEHLQVKQRPIGSIQRISLFPITHFRAQLVGIRDAIKEARRLEIPEIRVVTDSLPFMHFFVNGWKKRDGSPVANEKMYLKIKELTETVKVHFKGVTPKTSSEDSLLMKVQEMANEGLGFPKQHRDTKEYGLSVEELLAGKDAVYSVEGTSTRRARVIKSTTGCSSGVVWDRMVAVPLEGDEAAAAEEWMSGVKRKTNATMMHAVMEHADRMGFEEIVIRTNNPYIVRTTLGFLEVWHRNDWVDARWRSIKEQELWKRIWELTQRIEIIWDLIEEVDEVKDEMYLAKYRKNKKVGRPKKNEKGGRPTKKKKGIPPAVD